MLGAIGSAAEPAASRNCLRGSFIAFPPRKDEKATRYCACSPTKVWNCAPADGTKAALSKEQGSARPLAARIIGYLSRASCGRGRNDRLWPFCDIRDYALESAFGGKGGALGGGSEAGSYSDEPPGKQYGLRSLRGRQPCVPVRGHVVWLEAGPH